ncbi:hypothetical protein ACN4EG_17030 [Alkalinema pantanalense CENA528]|uniref:hypothetical protein n=1 Tax=Alkalinema pantanalense TaxID=1620705 RepID=UPI003D6E0305
MPWHIKRLVNGLLVQEYDREPDDESEELLTPDDKTQDECYPNFAHLKPGETLVLPEEKPQTTASGSWYPSQYEDLDEFLNSDPGAIDKLDSGNRSRRFNWRYYEPNESL